MHRDRSLEAPRRFSSDADERRRQEVILRLLEDVVKNGMKKIANQNILSPIGLLVRRATARGSLQDELGERESSFNWLTFKHWQFFERDLVTHNGRLREYLRRMEIMETRTVKLRKVVLEEVKTMTCRVEKKER